MGWISFLKNKSNASNVLKKFVTFVERQFRSTVLNVITDNGSEYVEVDIFFKDKGIRHIRIPPYSHQSNGVAERYNRTIQTMVRSMLLDLKPADNHLWAEACTAAIYIRNRLPHSQLKQRTSSGDNTST